MASTHTSTAESKFSPSAGRLRHRVQSGAPHFRLQIGAVPRRGPAASSSSSSSSYRRRRRGASSRAVRRASLRRWSIGPPTTRAGSRRTAGRRPPTRTARRCGTRDGHTRTCGGHHYAFLFSFLHPVCPSFVAFRITAGFRDPSTLRPPHSQ